MIITREEEIFKEAWEYFHDTLRKLDMVKCSPTGDWTDGLVRGFIKGAKWADNNPRMFKGQTDKMEEREIAFMDWWLENHKGESPTFADAIAWAYKTMAVKACEWLEENYYNKSQGTWQEIKKQFIKDFRKAMNNYETLDSKR